MGKQLLTITALKADTDPLEPDKDRCFRAQVNPSEFQHNRSIKYNDCKTLGAAASSADFDAVDEGTISFSLILDGTGVLDETGQVTDVQERLEALSKLVFEYQGEAHEPNRVQVAWGPLIYNCRLTSLDTQFTLFKPSGAPLRARCALSFQLCSSPVAGQLQANASSPDLSHQVAVVDGDTLPLLCQRIYGDASYYPEVAEFNGLRSVRDLRPGQLLHFPPLR